MKLTLLLRLAPVQKKSPNKLLPEGSFPMLTL